MMRRTANTAGLIRTTLASCAIFFASFFANGANAQIAKVLNDDGRQFFVNAEPPSPKFAATKPRTNIYLPSETSFTGRSRLALDMGRDGVEKIVREAADRHRVDPALVRAVIETESNWNPKAWSHKGAGGLMQLIPT
ncbi:MAG TPA: transglycosylase SLT domain-containing protein, partial [Candidatus Polarisedimenticolia bacterium]|nr:transglycosylase SLT domain-containing protein [Candidatus Polarisedimenticolia bacterium]